MHHFMRQAGFVAAVALLSAGCGGKNQAEMPTPESEVPSAPGMSYTPVSVESIPVENISKDLLNDTRRATLEERIHFGFDQADLSADARQSLAAKAEVLRAIPDLRLQIEGHADERGSDEYNLALSNRRSAAAKRFLVNLGISANRLETVGYGEEQPLDQNETEAAWARNRRDEFRVSSGPMARQ
jgi:peptidoglycan-associated lipoprotein